MNQKGLLIIVRGLPGSGKTTCINKFKNLSNFLRLDPDKVDILSSEFISFSSKYSETLPIKNKIYRYLLQKACEVLPEGKVVIWEQPWRNRDLFILTLKNIATIGYRIQHPELSSLPFRVLIIEISVTYDEAIKRITKRFEDRDHSLNPNDFIQFHQLFECFNNLGFPFKCFAITQTSEELAKSVQDFIIDHIKDVI